MRGESAGLWPQASAKRTVHPFLSASISRDRVPLAVQVTERPRSTRKHKRRRRPTGDFFRPDQVAELLDVSLRTLETWRKEGKGPRFSKEGRLVFYLRSDIDEWHADRTGRSTAEFKDKYVPAAKR